MSVGGDERILHLIWSDWDNVPYLVSPETLAAAERATADDAPRPHMNFGDVRRGGDIDELEDLLSWHGDASLEPYIAGIERAAGRPPGSGALWTRLKALDDFVFAGEDEATDDYDYLPGDDFGFREEQSPWDGPQVRSGTCSPERPAPVSGLAAAYCTDQYASGSPWLIGAPPPPPPSSPSPPPPPPPRWPPTSTPQAVPVRRLGRGAAVDPVALRPTTTTGSPVSPVTARLTPM